jgi:hypothetical protein
MDAVFWMKDTSFDVKTTIAKSFSSSAMAKFFSCKKTYRPQTAVMVISTITMEQHKKNKK